MKGGLTATLYILESCKDLLKCFTRRFDNPQRNIATGFKTYNTVTISDGISTITERRRDNTTRTNDEGAQIAYSLRKVNKKFCSILDAIIALFSDLYKTDKTKSK